MRDPERRLRSADGVREHGRLVPAEPARRDHGRRGQRLRGRRRVPGEQRRLRSADAHERSPGSRTCGDCPAGFSGTGETGCVDVNECEIQNGGCDPRTECVNTAGSRTCGPCPPGFTGDGVNGCVDVNECQVNNGGCDPRTQCTNDPGSRTCGDCPAGFSGTGETGCVDVNECAIQNGGCDPRTECANTAGSRTCGPCRRDSRATGVNGCVDVNECRRTTAGVIRGRNARTIRRVAHLRRLPGRLQRHGRDRAASTSTNARSRTAAAIRGRSA